METTATRVTTNTIKMPIATFLQLEEVFCQRNTRLRVNRTAKRLNANPLPTHQAVVLARYPNEKLVVLDGNTRSLAWKEGKSVPPPFVNATIYRVANDAEAKNLYESLDSRDAVENSKDKIWSAMQIVYGEDFQYFQTSTFIKGKFATAIRYALESRIKDGRKQRGNVKYEGDIANLVDFISYFKWELQKLDELLRNPNGKDFSINQAQVNVCILLLKKYGLRNDQLNNSIRRWVSCDFTPAETTPTHNKIDAINWMQKYLMTDPVYVNLKGSNGTEMPLLLSYHLTFFEAWMQGNMKLADNPSAKRPKIMYDLDPWFEGANLPPLQSAGLI